MSEPHKHGSHCCCTGEPSSAKGVNRRAALLGVGAVGAVAVAALSADVPEAQAGAHDPPAEPALPPSNMVFAKGRVALVVTDPQIDFLSPDGVTWKTAR
jgi:biuret amidohydrolase